LVDVYKFFFQEIEAKLKAETKLEFHKTADAFILVILSHGTEGKIVGTGCKKIEIEEKILASLDGIYFEAMVGKPKIVVVQACRGGRKYYKTNFKSF